MSKQQRKHAHNPRNPNTCRRCLTNHIGKTRLAYGHTICQACAKREPTEQNIEADSNAATNLPRQEQGAENEPHES